MITFQQFVSKVQPCRFSRKPTRLERQNVATIFLDGSSEFSQNTELSVVPDFGKFLGQIMLGGHNLMKTIFRILMLGIMISAATATLVFAQDAQDACKDIDANVVLYKQFTDNFDKTIDKKKIAVDAGKQYIDKYSSCPDYAAQVDYIKKSVPNLETQIAADAKGRESQALITNFNNSLKASKTADILTYGKQILAGEPDFLDVNLTLASAGFDQAIANPPVDTYNTETINYSKTAIAQLEANKPSKTGVYGVNQYSYKTDQFGGRENALGLMNYNIGYILYYRQGKNDPAKKKEALPYFYKATQHESFSKNDPFVYQTIGAWYLDEAIRMDTDRLAKIKVAGNKDTDETLAIYGMEKGYIDRSIDAYSRAYKLASTTTPADPKRKDALYAKLKELYAFRYDGKIEGIDAFVGTVMNKPLPDPTTEPTPVKEEAPATTTTTSTTSTTKTAMTSDTTSENTAGMAKPTTKTTVTTTNTKATPTGTTTTTKSKTVVKTTPKKKGTR